MICISKGVMNLILVLAVFNIVPTIIATGIMTENGNSDSFLKCYFWPVTLLWFLVSWPFKKVLEIHEKINDICKQLQYMWEDIRSLRDYQIEPIHTKVNSLLQQKGKKNV